MGVIAQLWACTQKLKKNYYQAKCSNELNYTIDKRKIYLWRIEKQKRLTIWGFKISSGLILNWLLFKFKTILLWKMIASLE